MYYLTVTKDFAAAHALRGYEGKCARTHGHNFKLEVVVRGPRLNALGLLIDFVELKGRLDAVLEELDHHDLNAHPAFQTQNPTAENLARFIYERVGADLPEGVAMHAVTVHETERAAATYRPETSAPGGAQEARP